ncbi:hypothetical protein D5S18_06635 [Nocardia panacis]|uniref:Uncharacterized protein n=1 Tax=Nocardia panacis TaxID=2340916 RepID=A0A3A4K919_9NOCA|nr:hypothetical protein [Nocardia panacis]RJO77947.1 hypothetical protein D5S18_06635 [Nocardia panacis]
MPDSTGIEPGSEFVSSVATRILRRAGKYADEVNDFVEGVGVELTLLDSFNAQVESVVYTFEPPTARRRGDSLVFASIYRAAKDFPTLEADRHVPAELIAALLAAEVEFRGPLRLSRTQTTLLAEVYERLGASFVGLGLPGHAVLSYRRASFLHRANEDTDAEDRCGLRLARARTSALPPGWRRWGPQLSDLLCGYGYQPFRLLGFIAVQLVVFTAILLLFAAQPVTETVYLSVTSYLNPAGVGDTVSSGPGGRTMLAVESWAGAVTMSVFFALLVRKWFRM